MLEVTIFDAPLDARGVGLDDEDRGAREPSGQRLRAAHAAESGGQHESPAQLVIEVAFGDT